MKQRDFFIDGGTMRLDTPSYVERPADRQLLRSVLASQFCYMACTRQMGKSSLVFRILRDLRERGGRVAVVDLTRIGSTVRLNQWYLGIFTYIVRELEITIDVIAWWQEHIHLAFPLMFIEFMREVILADIGRGTVTIFIDEIDTMLNFSWRGDFFGAIRKMYDLRASEPAFQRLTFVLLGVLTPADLETDHGRSLFNVFTRIVLQELSLADAAPLRHGLEACYPEDGDRILKRIFYWADGHPYLTQLLCRYVAESYQSAWTDEEIDQLVQTVFFSEGNREDSNLNYVSHHIRYTSRVARRQMLKLYRKVYTGKLVAGDDSSPIQNRLELIGLIRNEKGRLFVRNRIYRMVFNESWIEEQMPPSTRTYIIAVVVAVALLVIVLGVLSTIFR